MSERGAQAGLWLAAAWVGLLLLMLIAITVFQEPDDGVWTLETWVGKAAVAALVVLGGTGVVHLATLSRASRWTATPVPALIGGLSGVSLLNLAANKLGGASLTWVPTHESWLTGLLALASLSVVVFILSPATWRALDAKQMTNQG
jgi:hypothetical protein